MHTPAHISNLILLEDPYLLVLHKPAGLMVEPDRNNYPNLLQQVKQYLKYTTPKGEEVYAQHLHRLDRPVSGIILFTKQKSILRNLSEQFAERKVRKYYQAITSSAPSPLKGTLENWHRKEKKKAMITDEPLEYSEKISLSYEVLSYANEKYLWDIELHTGKYHQIRGQLAKVGCPIDGDTLYGSQTPYLPDAIALHAYKLVFIHPVSGKEIRIENKKF